MRRNFYTKSTDNEVKLVKHLINILNKITVFCPIYYVFELI